MMHQPRLLTCKVPERQPEDRLRGSWVFERDPVPVRRRRRRELFVTFHEPVVEETRHLGQRVIANYQDATENAAASCKRQLTSSPRSLTLYTSGTSPQQTKGRVSCAAQTNDFLRSWQTSLGLGVLTEGKQAVQLARGKTSAGDEVHVYPRVVGLPGKEWVRLVRANPQDPVLRRFSIKSNNFACAPSIGAEENLSIGSRPESSSGCGSLTGKRFPAVHPPSSHVSRTKPFNAAIGTRNRSSVSSMFQQSCERIFASNRCRYQWTMTGSELLYQKRLQREEEEELARLASYGLTHSAKYEFFVSKTPNNSPRSDVVINDNEVNDNDIENEDENDTYDNYEEDRRKQNFEHSNQDNEHKKYRL